MAIEVKLPKMGESITEATIINWCKNPGEFVQVDDVLLEVATDKVDNEVPAPCSGKLLEVRFQKNDIVSVGEVIALIEPIATGDLPSNNSAVTSPLGVKVEKKDVQTGAVTALKNENVHNQDFFLSPLLISIAQKENVSLEELRAIPATGAGGRLRKSDLYGYLKGRKYPLKSFSDTLRQTDNNTAAAYGFMKPEVTFNPEKDRLVEMDRMRRLIAGHMLYSKQTAPHVTSYLEVDVTGLVAWRDNMKDNFQQQHGQKLTFTPIFIEAVAKALLDFPMMNVSVNGNNIIQHGNINIGMATALPNGNLIVPVVKNANTKPLQVLAEEVNRLAEKSREQKLTGDDLKGSTFTISNVGTFGSLMGTPIINQPEAAIVAFGIIKKRPEVITTINGDEIAIRSMMFLSLSFDHRIIDGYLGGSFLRKLGDYLESYNATSI